MRVIAQTLLYIYFTRFRIHKYISVVIFFLFGTCSYKVTYRYYDFIRICLLLECDCGLFVYTRYDSSDPLKNFILLSCFTSVFFLLALFYLSFAAISTIKKTSRKKKIPVFFFHRKKERKGTCV